MDLKTVLIQLRAEMEREQEADVKSSSKASAVAAAAQARIDRRGPELNKLTAFINSLGGGPNA